MSGSGRQPKSRGIRARSRAALCAATVALATLCALPIGAAEAQPQPAAAAFHWAYAAAFGTGLYRLGDNVEVLAVQVPISRRLRMPVTGGPPGLRLLLPVTLGIEDTELGELFTGAIPRRAEQLSLLPGVEIESVRSERWKVKVRAQLGWGEALGAGGEHAFIYALGLRSRYLWSDARARPAWIGGVLWSGFDPDHGERESMARVTSGVELDLALERWRFRGQRMHLMPHFAGHWYLDTAKFLSSRGGVLEQIDRELEIGLSAGRDEPFHLFNRELERIGFALTCSEDSVGIRFFLNSLF